MSSTQEIMQFDTGKTVSGVFTQLGLGALDDLTGCQAKFSLFPTGGGTPITYEAAATFGTFDKANNSVALSYRLQVADVANPVGQAAVLWTIVLPDGGKIHGPSARDGQYFLRINPWPAP